MAYNVSTYGAPDWGRGGEKGHDMRPTPLAVPAGGPVPNTTQTKKPYLNTKPSLPEPESAVKAKRMFSPNRNEHKLAYALGLELGKRAAYPLQEITPPSTAIPNTLPPHVPSQSNIPAPKVVWPSTQTISVGSLSKGKST